jgi:hypothetical protein
MDAASGMRVFEKALLEHLSPLPAGLHFTPAMTARAVCLGVAIVEVPIPYAERKGQSKLRIFADGLRFLQVIFGVIFSYYPWRVFGPLGSSFGLVALAYGVRPVLYYFSYHRLEEEMIHRLLTILTLSVCALVVLSFGLIAQRASDLAIGRRARAGSPRWLEPAALVLGLLLGVGGILLNSRTILEYASSGHIAAHWVYVLTGGLAVISGTLLFCFGVTLGLVGQLPSRWEGRR